MARKFEDTLAVRERVPVLLALYGPSGSGKSFSALRLASGIQRVVGGEVFAVDTESRRLLHYAERFRFRHVDFKPPFSPQDYLEVIQHCAGKGAKTIVIDSCSQEWEGPGGVLEMHEAEVRRRAGDDFAKAERVKMTAWVKPKQDHQRLVNAMLQTDCNFVLTFRAKDKLDVKKGEQPKPLGWMPIGDMNWLFEMTAACLLYPAGDGHPVWNPEMPGEKALIKNPTQFRDIFAKHVQLTEDVGEALAKWAAGGAAPAGDVKSLSELVSAFKACKDDETFNRLDAQKAAVWDKLNEKQRGMLSAAANDANARLITEVGAGQ